MSRFPRAAAALLSLSLVVAACGDDSILSPGIPAPDPEATDSASTTSGARPTTTQVSRTTEAPPGTTDGPDTTGAPDTTDPPPAPVPVVSDSFRSESHADPPLEIVVVIPVISGIPQHLADAINEAIDDGTIPLVDQFKADVLVMGDYPDDFGKSQLDFNYFAPWISSELLSIRFHLSLYYQGAAHPFASVFTLNFDPRSGALLSLSDVLLPGSVPEVAELVGERLIENVYDGDEAEASGWIGVMSEAALGSWWVSPAGLEFGFDQYEVGPGAMGTVAVVIPWSDVGQLIDPAGPAGAFAAQD